jgi:hypothetical protein
LEPGGGFEDHNCTTLEDLEAVNCKRSKYEIKVRVYRGQTVITLRWARKQIVIAAREHEAKWLKGNSTADL